MPRGISWSGAGKVRSIAATILPWSSSNPRRPVLSHPLWTAGLRNSEDSRMAHQKIKCHLSGSAIVSLSNLGQYSSSSTLSRRKIPVPERCVSHHSDSPLGAIRQTGVARFRDLPDDIISDCMSFAHF